MSFVDLISFIDASSWIRSSLNMGCALLAGLLAITPLFGDRKRPRGKWWQSPWLFFLMLAVSLFSCRVPELFFPDFYNPDEAQMLAQAITFQTYPVPWLDIDTTTSGPINSYALLWSAPFGIHPNYFTGRVTDLFCALGMMAFLYLAGRQLAGEIAARLALLPTFLFLCATSNTDFVHYSSEQVSLFLIGWAIYLLARLRKTPGTTWLLINLGLVLGLLPFAKLQSVLPGAGLGLGAIWFIWRSSRPRIPAVPIRILILAVAAVTPAVVILSTVFCFGAFNDFWISYIKTGQAYIHTTGLDFYLDLLGFMFYESDELALPVYLTIFITLLIGLFVILQKLKMSRLTRDWWLLAVGFMAIIFETICYPGTGYHHYFLFLLPAFSLLAIVNLRVLRTSLRAHASPRVTALLLQAVAPGLFFAFFFFFQVYPHPTLFGCSFQLDTFFHFIIPAVLFGWIAVAYLFAAYAMAGASSNPPQYSWRCRQRFAGIACFAAFFLIPMTPLVLAHNIFRNSITKFVQTPPSQMAQAIIRHQSPGARLAIWGWAPEYIVQTGIPLGTRDSIGQFEIGPNPYQAYYRQRFLADMRKNQPALFLEALGPKNYGYHDSKAFGIATYPELNQFISDQYQQVEEIDSMRLFVRNDLAKFTEKSE